VQPIFAESERLFAVDGGAAQRRVEVREQGAPSSRLPSQRRRHIGRAHVEEKQPALAGVMSRSRVGKLRGRREVNEAVPMIVIGSFEGPDLARGGPDARRHYAIDGGDGRRGWRRGRS
jgi:hypothetical protein